MSKKVDELIDALAEDIISLIKSDAALEHEVAEKTKALAELISAKTCQSETAKSPIMLRKPYSMQYEIAGKSIFSPVRPPVEPADQHGPNEWHRFELISEDKSEIERLETLCKDKGLTRQDLAVILFTLRIRPGFQRSDFGIW